MLSEANYAQNYYVCSPNWAALVSKHVLPVAIAVCLYLDVPK